MSRFPILIQLHCFRKSMCTCVSSLSAPFWILSLAFKHVWFHVRMIWGNNINHTIHLAWDESSPFIESRSSKTCEHFLPSLLHQVGGFFPSGNSGNIFSYQERNPNRTTKETLGHGSPITFTVQYAEFEEEKQHSQKLSFFFPTYHPILKLQPPAN